MADLADQSRDFASELQTLLRASFNGDHVIRAIPGTSERFTVQPFSEKSPNASIPLFVKGERLAELSFTYYLDLDHEDTHLKAVRSDFTIKSVLDRTPLFRLEYLSNMRNKPIAHWQVHAERGSLTHLLTHAWQKNNRKHQEPHLLESLHLPVGGERFRPCLEDLIQFLIEECGVDGRRTWRKAVDSGRLSWRRRQLASAVRDDPATSASVLAKLGYTVKEPKAGGRRTRTKALKAW